jgi:hypothetical protein
MNNNQESTVLSKARLSLAKIYEYVTDEGETIHFKHIHPKVIKSLMTVAVLNEQYELAYYYGYYVYCNHPEVTVTENELQYYKQRANLPI